jgi:hypothetical protein
MHHLTPVGLTEDGASLVLVDEAGVEFHVRVDHRFRTALGGDPARAGKLEMKMESALRPRDIQARIRAGESAEDVAAAAQSTIEAIMPFAGPVLAERAHVAETAQRASIRRRTSDSSPAARTLDEAAAQYLTEVGVRVDDVSWDAWRRDDGRWTVIAVYPLRGTEHRAAFTYDQPGRYVLADDDEGRLLTGELVPATPGAAPERRLSAVTDDELPLGDDALELVRGPQPVMSDPEVEPFEDEPAAVIEHLPVADRPSVPPRTTYAVDPDTTDLSATADAVRAAATNAFEDIAADHADADWMTEEAPEVADLRAPAASEPDDVVAPEDIAPEPSEDAKPRKKGRSSVPSWDEIMFGGGGSRD